MYVTKPLSMYRNFPTTLSVESPDAPYSGYLVVTDEESEGQDTFCWGACKHKRVKNFPFPQDKILSVVHPLDQYEETKATKVWFIPVLDQPLSSNCYYVIRAKGKYKGRACTCSREEDMDICCFSYAMKDKKPKPFDPRNIYQQFKIYRHHGSTFFAKSVAPDGFPPKLLRKKGWEVRCSTSYQSQLSEALGLDTSLRPILPKFNFPIFNRHSTSIVVGKWYCPFVFVREETEVRYQMKKSMFYEMTLEQRWEEIYSCTNVNNESNIVVADVNVQREVALVGGMEATMDDGNDLDRFVWFRVPNQNRRKGLSVGLSLAIIENMRWVQEQRGWGDGGEREEKVEMVEEIRSESGWERFGCYVLVESFVLRRMNGSLVFKCDFRHTHKIQCKWE